MMIEAMLDVRRAIFEGYERLHKVLLQVVQHDAICRRLMTVPGVGTVAALSFKVGVDDPSSFRAISDSWRAFWPYAKATPVGNINRLRGSNYQTGRRQGSQGALRGSSKPAAAGQEVVGFAGVGPADRQTVEHAVRDRRGRTHACEHPAQDVGQSNRLPPWVWRQGHTVIAFEACAVIAAGTQKISAGVTAGMSRRSNH
ncbi:hypothetical protein OWC48_23550 [Bradyrhizobium sp. Arg816]|nr:hypothetical protein [Bradyrhizobium sp. Arg816]MDI3563370.1 hypothetical protein [Bradyrhizobium sp. Arg816]